MDADEEVARSALSGLPPEKAVATLEALGLAPSVAALVPDALTHSSVRMAFYSNQLCERGTEVALFDYADFGERLLGLTAYVLYPVSSEHNFAPSTPPSNLELMWQCIQVDPGSF